MRSIICRDTSVEAYNWANHSFSSIPGSDFRLEIARYRGQMSEVARRLRIGRSTLYRKLDDLGLGAAKNGEADENVAQENVATR